MGVYDSVYYSFISAESQIIPIKGSQMNKYTVQTLAMMYLSYADIKSS